MAGREHRVRTRRRPLGGSIILMLFSGASACGRVSEDDAPPNPHGELCPGVPLQAERLSSTECVHPEVPATACVVSIQVVLLNDPQVDWVPRRLGYDEQQRVVFESVADDDHVNFVVHHYAADGDAPLSSDGVLVSHPKDESLEEGCIEWRNQTLAASSAQIRLHEGNEENASCEIWEEEAERRRQFVDTDCDCEGDELIRIEEFNPDGTLARDTVVAQDASGTDRITTYAYDAEGREMERCLLDEQMPPSACIDTTYDDESGRATHTSVGFDGSRHTWVTRQKDGVLVSREVDRQDDGVPEESWSLLLDEQDRILSITQLTEVGTVNDEYVYEGPGGPVSTARADFHYDASERVVRVTIADEPAELDTTSLAPCEIHITYEGECPVFSFWTVPQSGPFVGALGVPFEFTCPEFSPGG